MWEDNDDDSQLVLQLLLLSGEDEDSVVMYPCQLGCRSRNVIFTICFYGIQTESRVAHGKASFLILSAPPPSGPLSDAATQTETEVIEGG